MATERIVTVVDPNWTFGLDLAADSLDDLPPCDMFLFGMDFEMFLGMDDSSWSLTAIDNDLSLDNTVEENDLIFSPALRTGIGTGIMIGMAIKGQDAIQEIDGTFGGPGNFIY